MVSGPVAGIDAVSKRFESEGLRVRRLNTAKAFHSALVEPALDALEAFADGLTVEAPSLAVVSNLTGRVVEPGESLDGVYWRRHAREPVAFAAGVRALAELGVDLVVGNRAALGVGADSGFGVARIAREPAAKGAGEPAQTVRQ